MPALPRHATLVLLAALVLAVAGPAAATVYSVGGGGTCTHPSLASALAAAAADPTLGPHLIKERNREILTGGITLSQPLDNIIIEGGYNSCSDAAPAPNGQLVIRKSGPGPVMSLTGGNAQTERRTLSLKRVTLTGGNAGATGDGGGVHVFGSFQLHLGERSVIAGNSARDGGGVYLASLSSNPMTQARLLMNGGAVIENNIASRDGGGVSALGGARILVTDGQINRNHAARNGGGVHLATSSTQLELVPTASQVVRLSANSAGDENAPFSDAIGRGGAVYSNNARIFSNFHGHPGENRIRIDNNNANHGGAIFVNGASDGSFTMIELRDAWIHNNYARGRGGAFHSRNSVDWIVTHDSVGPCLRRVLVFTWREPCSRLSGNVADNETTPNTPGGGVFYLAYNPAAPRAIARIRRTLMDNNIDFNGLAAIVAAEGANEYFIERSIMRDNKATGIGSGIQQPALLHTQTANSWLLYSTIMDNQVLRMFVFGGSKLTTRGSILSAPGTQVWDRTASAMDAGGCLLAHTRINLPFDTTVGDARLDADGRPTKRSIAWDFCDGPVTADAEGHAAHDIPGVPNYLGRNDLGAYELADAIFINGMGHFPGN